jgi:hypothetical protein
MFMDDILQSQKHFHELLGVAEHRLLQFEHVLVFNSLFVVLLLVIVHH